MNTKLPIRKKHNRLKGFDYSQHNYYYVTICTHEKKELLGAIENKEMILNEPGEMVKQIMDDIPVYYPGIELDQYVIMPNHIHAIIVINQINNGQPQGAVPTLSLSNIINRVKTITTKKYIDGVKNNNWPPFDKKIWQRSFYDHIIRNEHSLKEIREYIGNNPSTWEKDEENTNIDKS